MYDDFERTQKSGSSALFSGIRNSVLCVCLIFSNASLEQAGLSVEYVKSVVIQAPITAVGRAPRSNLVD